MARYDEANKEYNRYVSQPALDRGFGVNIIGREGKVLFVALSIKVALDSLVSGRPVYPPDNPPHGAAYLGVHVAERCYEKLSRQARRIVPKGFHPAWSPDGTKLVYTMGLLKSNAVAVLDLETAQTELLTMPGKDPEWSPDGRHIAFVRDRPLLPLDRLTGLTVQTWQLGYGPSHVEEVWVMDMTSRKIWRVTKGGYPHWGHKSNRLYYTSRQDHTLYSVSIEERDAKPKAVLSDCSAFPVVSPDERYVADHRFRELRIIDVGTGQIVRTWFTPPRPREGLRIHWSPDGHELYIGGAQGSEMGLWIYDMATGKTAKIMDEYVTTTRRSAGKHPKLAFALGMPLMEIWMAELKPDVPTVKSFDSVQQVHEHCLDWIDWCNHLLEIDPEYTDAHYIRTDCALWMGHEKADKYLKQFGQAMIPDYYSAEDRATFCSLVLDSSPEIRDRLLPLVLLSARKGVEKEPENPDYLRTLGRALHQAEEWNEAEAVLLKAFELSGRLSDPHQPQTVESLQAIVELYEAWGKPEKAKEWREKLSETETDDE